MRLQSTHRAAQIDPGNCSRRQFLELLSLSALGGVFTGPLSAFIAPDNSLPHFEEVPASASGIHWKHVAGLSREMYMPETAGAGCAFVDYDNDGWMDIYLVNSGPCD